MLNVPFDPIIIVFFAYGLSFFTMGSALAFEAGWRGGDRMMRRAMVALAFFALVHGIHEWFEMFVRIADAMAGVQPALGVNIARVSALYISFAALVAAGCSLMCRSGRGRYRPLLVGLLTLSSIGVIVLALRLLPDWSTFLLTASVWSRYSLGMTGATITGIGFIRRGKDAAEINRAITRGFDLAGASLIVYGLLGQTAPPQSMLFPSTVYNADTFHALFGFPVQVLRTAAAGVATVGLLVALRAQEQERARAMEAATTARLAAEARARQEMARHEDLQKALLRRMVAAQEEERSRIARELHDETGQTLTALSYRVAALTPGKPLTTEASDDLRALTKKALGDLRGLVTDLRPAQLDDLGLAAALHWLGDEFHRRMGLDVEVAIEGRKSRLPRDIETTLFRIAQEALTNVVRHSGVDYATLHLGFGPSSVMLQIEDAGQGFDADTAKEVGGDGGPAWGLIGMEERAASVGGELILNSDPGQGTIVSVTIPIPGVNDHDQELADSSASG